MTSGTTSTAINEGPQSGTAPVTSTPRLLVFVVGALTLGIGVAVWLEYPREIRHFGFLHSVNETITAGRQARITHLLVKPGQLIQPGQPILTLQDASLEASRQQQQQAIAALEAELTQAQARASVEIADRKAKLEAEIFETQLKLATYEERRFDHRLSLFAAENRVMVAEAEDRLSQVQVASVDFNSLPFPPLTMADAAQIKPKKKDFLYELQERETTRNKLEASEAQVDLCEQRINLLRKQLETTPTQINEAFGVHVIQTRLKSAQAALAQLDAETPTLTINATRHGTVGTFCHTAGELVSPRETIVELFDSEQPYVLAEIPTSAVGEFQCGTAVELMFPGNVRLEGRVDNVPPQAAVIPGPETRLSVQPGRLRVKVLPQGRVWPQVPIGTYVEVKPLSAKTSLASASLE